MKTGIYKITNTINGKAYIGQSIDIEKRWSDHKNRPFNINDRSYNYPLYRAIRKYGLENFNFEVLEECNRSQLDEKEIYYIGFFDTWSNGYNQKDGGSTPHYSKLTEEKISHVIHRLKTSRDNSDIIGAEVGIAGRTVREINIGKMCHRDNETYPIRPSLSYREGPAPKYYCSECGVEISTNTTLCHACAHKLRRKIERPETMELAKMVVELGFTGVGKVFGVADNTIRKWCKSENIPVRINELKVWYRAQINDNVLICAA